MKMIEVKESSNIHSIGYDEKTQTCIVQFHKGKYNYFPVTKEVFEQIIQSESIGAAIRKLLINNPYILTTKIK